MEESAFDKDMRAIVAALAIGKGPNSLDTEAILNTASKLANEMDKRRQRRQAEIQAAASRQSYNQSWGPNAIGGLGSSNRDWNT